MGEIPNSFRMHHRGCGGQRQATCYEQANREFVGVLHTKHAQHKRQT